MEFLENLYNIENFGIYLFVVIGILIVIFLVILFFGKKDEKKRKEAMDSEPVTKVEVSPSKNEETTFKEVSAPAPLDIPALDPVTEEPILHEAHPTNNVVLNDSFVTETKDEQQPSLLEEPLEPKTDKEFDFDALAAAISKELESIDVNKDTPQEEKVEPVLPKEEEKEINYQIFEPVLEEVKEKPIITEPVIEQKEEVVKPRPVMPTVFSSVYVNRKAEKKEEEEVKIEAPKEEVVVPVVPKIELPKMMDLPKKNDNM